MRVCGSHSQFGVLVWFGLDIGDVVEKQCGPKRKLSLCSSVLAICHSAFSMENDKLSREHIH